jgi:antitoxin (DNA-binding transcriptional repressor) of toxin-antitoxin stability system
MPPEKIIQQRQESVMSMVTIEEAQAKLSDLIHGLQPDEELVITENDQPVARLIPANTPSRRKPRQSGTLQGTVLYMAPDFDAPLEDFKEYME